MFRSDGILMNRLFKKNEYSLNTTQASIMPGTVAVLLDFDNFYHDKPTNEIQIWLPNEINRIIKVGLDLLPTAQYILVRMYGGWVEGGTLTKRADAINSVVADGYTFPHRYQNMLIRGDIGLVTRLYLLPTIEWNDTLRSRNGLPKLRVSKEPADPTCTRDALTCPIEVLKRFTTKSKRGCQVSGCTVRNDAAFSHVEQKMVDGMIMCDLLSLLSYDNLEGACILSNDKDLFPAIALGAAVLRKPIHLVLANQSRQIGVQSELGNLGVKRIDWSV